MNAQILILLVLGCFYQLVREVNGSLHASNSHNNYHSMRNSLLKNIILSDVRRAKTLVKKTKILYNKILTRYYEINEKYYSLSENDRILLEAILSLTY